MILNDNSWTEITDLTEGTTYVLQAKRKVDKRATEGCFVNEPVNILFARGASAPTDTDCESSFRFTKDTRNVYVRSDIQHVTIKVEKE